MINWILQKNLTKPEILERIKSALNQVDENWEEVEINLSEMYPSFRGRKLSLPNFSSQEIEEITFLIANKENENFKLMIDKIYLE